MPPKTQNHRSNLSDARLRFLSSPPPNKSPLPNIAVCFQLGKSREVKKLFGYHALSVHKCTMWLRMTHAMLSCGGSHDRAVAHCTFEEAISNGRCSVEWVNFSEYMDVTISVEDASDTAMSVSPWNRQLRVCHEHTHRSASFHPLFTHVCTGMYEKFHQHEMLACRASFLSFFLQCYTNLPKRVEKWEG